MLLFFTPLNFFSLHKANFIVQSISFHEVIPFPVLHSSIPVHKSTLLYFSPLSCSPLSCSPSKSPVTIPLTHTNAHLIGGTSQFRAALTDYVQFPTTLSIHTDGVTISNNRSGFSCGHRITQSFKLPPRWNYI